MRKLTMADMERMTIGMWVDYIIEYNNMEYRARKEIEKNTKYNRKTGKVESSKNRQATQADFDMF